MTASGSPALSSSLRAGAAAVGPGFPPPLNAGPFGAPQPAHPPKPPIPLSPTPLPPCLIAVRRADCGTLAQVGSAQLVGGGRGGGRYVGGAGGALVPRVRRPARAKVAPPFPSPAPTLRDCRAPGLNVVCLRRLVLRNRWRARRRSLRWGGWRRSRGSGAPAGPRGGGGLLPPPPPPLRATWTVASTTRTRLVVVCLRRQAGSPSLVLLKTTQPLPYLASCRASSPTRRTRSL